MRCSTTCSRGWPARPGSTAPMSSAATATDRPANLMRRCSCSRPACSPNTVSTGSRWPATRKVIRASPTRCSSRRGSTRCAPPRSRASRSGWSASSRSRRRRSSRWRGGCARRGSTCPIASASPVRRATPPCSNMRCCAASARRCGPCRSARGWRRSALAGETPEAAAHRDRPGARGRAGAGHCRHPLLHLRVDGADRPVGGERARLKFLPATQGRNWI